MDRRAKHFYEFGPFRLNVAERLLLRDGEAVPLTPKLFDILLALVENNGHILEKEEIMNRVWPDTVVEETNLTRNVSRLRKALGENPNYPQYIETIPWRGYRFVAPVAESSDGCDELVIEEHFRTRIVTEETDGANEMVAATTDQADRATAVSAPVVKLAATRASRFNRRLKVGIVLAALVAVSVIAFLFYERVDQQRVNPPFSFERMKLTRLTTRGNAYAPIISPDGKYFAYRETKGGLWVSQIGGETAVEVVPHLNGSLWGWSFTKDSNHLYYTVGDNNDYPGGVLYKLPALGGTPIKILEKINGVVSFSPDGKRMVCARRDVGSNKQGLIAADADGRNQELILETNPSSFIWAYQWSPGREAITVVISNSLPDGRKTWQLFEVPSVGGKPRPIGEPQGLRIIGLCWLPDGSGMVLTMRDGEMGRGQLWHIAYPSGEIKRITNDLSDYGSVTITADGSQLLTMQVEGANNIWVANLDGLTHPQQITTGIGHYDGISWAGTDRILYQSDEADVTRIYSVSADGSRRAKLSGDELSCYRPVMSPDGRYIAFMSRRSGSMDLCRIDNDGGNSLQLTTGPGDVSGFQFTPDGETIVYSKWLPSGNTLWKMAVTGGKPSLLCDKDIGPWTISPDGKRIAYQIFDYNRKRHVIHIRPLDSEEPAQVYDFPDLGSFRLCQWALGGRDLVCLDSNDSEILLLPTDGGRPRQLTSFNTGERILSFAISPDGKKLAFARGMTSFNAVLINNIR